tara:strand:+ start:1133 stop:1369 length:237 start_codon:yes stop_codon:yes gene_type:complete
MVLVSKKRVLIIMGIMVVTFCILMIREVGIAHFISNTIMFSIFIGVLALAFSTEKSDGRYETGYKDNAVPSLAYLGGW